MRKSQLILFDWKLKPGFGVGLAQHDALIVAQIVHHAVEHLLLLFPEATPVPKHPEREKPPDSGVSLSICEKPAPPGCFPCWTDPVPQR